jgi:FdhD protein
MPVFIEKSGQKFNAEGVTEVVDKIIDEAEVGLSVNGSLWLSFLCLAQDQEALALGFLYNEGVIHSLEEVAVVQLCPTGDHVDVWLKHDVRPPKTWRRTSGCGSGRAGTQGEEEAQTEMHVPDWSSPLPACSLFDLMTQHYKGQEIHHETGGTHSTALSDGGRIVLLVEDIGRHNTLDKLAGRILQEGIVLDTPILLTTGRITAEMVEKAARMKAGMLVSRTTPSSLAITLAESWNITLVGYARHERFTVYSHAERLNRDSCGDTENAG